METSDAELMRRVAKGDDAAFAELVRRHEPGVQRFVWGLLHDPEQARDVSQEAFIQVYRHRTRFNTSMSFRTWLYTIARNRAISILRRRRHEASLPIGEEGADDTAAEDFIASIPDPSADPRERASADERSQWIREVLERLDEPHRVVLKMKYLGGMKSQEIADVLGLELGTVWSRVHHGLKKLKTLLEERRDDI